jgi:hypothetical protein
MCGNPYPMRTLLIVAIACSLLAACSRGGNADSQDSTKDLAAGSACEKFAKWRQDFNDELLTYDETRERVKSIYEDGQKANSDAIKADTKDLLVQVTAKASGKVYFASEQMTKDCLALP